MEKENEKLALTLSSSVINLIFLVLGALIASVIFIYLIKTGIFSAKEVLEIVKTLPLGSPTAPTNSITEQKVLEIIKETIPSETHTLVLGTSITIAVFGAGWCVIKLIGYFVTK